MSENTCAAGTLSIQTLVTGISAITPLIWIVSHLQSDISYLHVKFQLNRMDSKWFLPMEMDRRASNDCSSAACRSLAIPLFCHCQFVLPFDMHVICIMHIWSTALILLPSPLSLSLSFPWYSLITMLFPVFQFYVFLYFRHLFKYVQFTEWRIAYSDLNRKSYRTMIIRGL